MVKKEKKINVKVYSVNINSLTAKNIETVLEENQSNSENSIENGRRRRNSGGTSRNVILHRRISKHEKKPHVLLVQETKLDETVSDEAVAIPGLFYDIYKKLIFGI